MTKKRHDRDIELTKQQRAFCTSPERIISWTNVGSTQERSTSVCYYAEVPVHRVVRELTFDKQLGFTFACTYLVAGALSTGLRVEVYCPIKRACEKYIRDTWKMLERNFGMDAGEVEKMNDRSLILASGAQLECFPMFASAMRGRSPVPTDLIVVDMCHTQMDDALLVPVLSHPTALVRVVGRDLPSFLEMLGPMMKSSI